MTIVGFDFTKIEAERKGPARGKVNINNNVTIKDVKDQDLNLGKEKKDALKFNFEFTVNYDPDIGKVLLEGEVIYMDEAKKVKEIVDNWKKDKKIEKDISTMVLNTVLTKSNVKALIISQDINLPSPIPLPKVQAQEKK